MGITGLLPLLKAITRNVHISQYANQRVAVDAYCWLHRGAYSCSTELCQNIPTVKYINFCLSRVQLLRSFNITPVLVFDGGALPSKKGQEEKRRKKRREERAKAAEYLQQGNRAAANDCYRKAVDITPRMAHKLIVALQQEGVECIVAPYEADAQLAFLSRTGYVHSIISEDSDLLPFGCTRVLFKMDSDGNGKEIQLSDLAQNTPLRFHNFTLDMFRQMCILSGCDYLASISGLGVKKAHSLLSKYRTMDRVFRFLKNDRNYIVPPDYEDAFERADRTFLHQSVFDHVNRKVVPLTPYPEGLDASFFPFCGAPLPDDIACLVASGRVDPYSYEPFEDEGAQLAQSGPPSASVSTYDSDSGATVALSCGQSDEEAAMTTRASRFQRNTPLSSSLGSSGGRHHVLGRTPSFGGGRSAKMPLLLPQRNSISSYFTPSSRRAQRPFVPPRGSQGSSQSSLEETPVEEEAVIELKSQGDEESVPEEQVAPVKEEVHDQDEDKEIERLRSRPQPTLPRPTAMEPSPSATINDYESLHAGRDTQANPEHEWGLVRTSTSSYEVLVARTPSPHSRFKVAPRPLLGDDSPTRRRLFFEDQVQVVVTSKYFSTTTTTTTTTTATATATAVTNLPPAVAAQRPNPALDTNTPAREAVSPAPLGSVRTWHDELVLDPTTQIIEESDEEDVEDQLQTRTKPTGATERTGQATGEVSDLARRNTRTTLPSTRNLPADALPAAVLSPPASRKRLREEGEEKTTSANQTDMVAPLLKKERTSALMAKVDEFLRSDVLEEEEEVVPKEKGTAKLEDAIDLTSEESPDFESPMLSRGKRLTTPLGFLSRTGPRRQASTAAGSAPSSKAASGGGGTPAVTLYSYFNKQGFARQSSAGSALEATPRRSVETPRASSPAASPPEEGSGEVLPKLEEDGIEIVGFTPRATPVSAVERLRANAQGGGNRPTPVTSPYFSSMFRAGGRGAS